MADPRRDLHLTDAAAVLARTLGGVGAGFGAIVAGWSSAVGTELAAVTTPVSLRGRELRIRCSSAAWAQSVNLMEQQLLEQLRAHSHLPPVDRIIARAGAAPTAPSTKPPPERAPHPQLDAASQLRIDEMVAGIDNPQLRAQVRAAAAAISRRDAATKPRS